MFSLVNANERLELNFLREEVAKLKKMVGGVSEDIFSLKNVG